MMSTSDLPSTEIPYPTFVCFTDDVILRSFPGTSVGDRKRWFPRVLGRRYQRSLDIKRTPLTVAESRSGTCHRPVVQSSVRLLTPGVKEATILSTEPTQDVGDAECLHVPTRTTRLRRVLQLRESRWEFVTPHS